MSKAGIRYIPTQVDIERRAYQIWLDGGCKSGTELANWLEAEKQIEAEILDSEDQTMESEGAPPKLSETRRKSAGA
jgi:hypothetical protein